MFETGKEYTFGIGGERKTGIYMGTVENHYKFYEDGRIVFVPKSRCQYPVDERIDVV